MTSTYDHRIIQGAESGSFLRRIDQLLQGEDGFYESVAEALGIAPNLVTNAHAGVRVGTAAGGRRGGAGASGVVSAEPDREMLQAVQAATSLLKAYRTHGHLAARVNPLGGEPKGDPALEPENLNLTPELMAKIPALDPADRRRGRDPARRAAADARRLLLRRSPTRSSTSPRTSSACGCAR